MQGQQQEHLVSLWLAAADESLEWLSYSFKCKFASFVVFADLLHLLKPIYQEEKNRNGQRKCCKRG